MTCPPKGYDPYRIASQGLNNGHETASQNAYRKKPLFVLVMVGRDDHVLILEHGPDIQEIEAVLVEVGKLFLFVPFKLHALLCARNVYKWQGRL
jgi:hypothetical protein